MVRGKRSLTPHVFVLSAIAAYVAGYAVWRPRMLRWGATDQEATEPLPGDDATPDPRVQSTRAITIDATREQVWPWIVQMGFERAGFYSHEWVERLLADPRYVEGHNATRIHPELQDLKVGDLIPYGVGVYARVHDIEPLSHLVAAEAWVLRPLPRDRTRLMVRYRGDGFIAPAMQAITPEGPPLMRSIARGMVHFPGLLLLARAIDFFISDPLHHYMEVGMLKGIKARAEGAVTTQESQAGSGVHDAATG
jgi:hypothetical protein